jgi:Ca2+-binding RTX toxin-like protein
MITVNDLSGTGVANVNLDLHAPAGSTMGDAQPDTVIVHGTPGDDSVVVAGTSAGVTVQGLSANVNIAGSEPALDHLIVRLLAGDDAASAVALVSGVINLTLEGGLGDDVLVGQSGKRRADG